MTKQVEKIIAAYNSTVDQINQVDYNPPGTSVWTRGDGTRYRDPGNIVALYGKNGSRIGNKNNKEPIQAFIQWLKSHPRTKDIGAVSDWYGTSKPREALQLGGVLFTLDDDNRLEFGSPSRLRNSDVWRHKPKESMKMNEAEQEYKVGDIVIALKGPHKGDKHKVIHCFDDGSCNIQPLTHRVKYRLGAAKAQPEDIQMAANEADYNKDAVDKEISESTYEFLVRLEEPASGDKTTWSVTAPDEESAVEYALRHTRLKRPRVVEVEKLRRMSTESQLVVGEVRRRDNYQGNAVAQLKESQLNEGVLDDQDDDGFMAKRQLYDLAKYAVELHRMIQDTDNLEPWVQAKITKAADYIDTVKHYLEYNDVRDAEATADVMGPPEMDDIDAVGNELDTMLSMETEVMEYGDEDEGSEVHPEDVLFWAVRRGIITPEQEDQAQIDQSSQLMMAAQDTADSIGRVWEIGSSDVSIWMRQFIDTCKAYGIKCDGPKAHLYESQLKAKMIYRNMLRELRGKKPESNIVTEDDEITNPAKEAKKKMKDAGWLNNIFIRPTKNGWTLKTYVASFGEDEGRNKEDKVMAKAKELETNAKELLGDVKTKIAKTPAKNIKEPFYSVHLLIHIPREIKGKK